MVSSKTITANIETILPKVAFISFWPFGHILAMKKSPLNGLYLGEIS